MSVADDVIKYAVAQVGKPYRWGATGPDAFDCSGLVYAAFRAAGHPFRYRVTTYALLTMGTGIGQGELAPGDLVFPDPGHVQIYVGGGKVVEAPHTGLNVRIVPMWGFWRARRLVPPTTNATAVNAGLNINPLDPLDPWGVLTGKNPLDALKQIETEVSTIAKVLAFVSDPANLLRVAEFLAGFALIALAAMRATGTTGQITSAVKAVA